MEGVVELLILIIEQTEIKHSFLQGLFSSSHRLQVGSTEVLEQRYPVLACGTLPGFTCCGQTP